MPTVPNFEHLAHASYIRGIWKRFECSCTYSSRLNKKHRLAQSGDPPMNAKRSRLSSHPSSMVSLKPQQYSSAAVEQLVEVVGSPPQSSTRKSSSSTSSSVSVDDEFPDIKHAPHAGSKKQANAKPMHSDMSSSLPPSELSSMLPSWLQVAGEESSSSTHSALGSVQLYPPAQNPHV